MALTAGDEAQVVQKLAELTTSEAPQNHQKAFQPHLSGFDTRHLYKIALSFYEEKEGKDVHLSYEDKSKLIALAQQASHGKYSPEKSPELGILDVVGKDREVEWQSLGDMPKEQAMAGFINLVDKLCPLFRTFVEAQKRDIEEEARLKKEEEITENGDGKKLKVSKGDKRRQREESLKQEFQQRQIENTLNQQTYYQFKSYAEQQHPGNPEKQAILINQLQEQHYQHYMQQLQKKQTVIKDEELEKKNNSCKTPEKKLEENSLGSNDSSAENDQDPDEREDWPKIVSPEMWTKKNINDFKETIRKESGDAVIKIGRGETVTVRVPTHEDGNSLFWEFATDGYDIGFGVYFEWSKPSTTQVSVHISESEDDDGDEGDYETTEDLECGDATDELQSDFKPSTTPISVIVPVYRRDSHEEVIAGSHQYPGQGVYLLKFDNSYALWRSKKLYYRVYYTRPSEEKKL